MDVGLLPLPLRPVGVRMATQVAEERLLLRTANGPKDRRPGMVAVPKGLFTVMVVDGYVVPALTKRKLDKVPPVLVTTTTPTDMAPRTNEVSVVMAHVDVPSDGAYSARTSPPVYEPTGTVAVVVFHVVDANWVLNVDWSEALAGSSRRYTLVVLTAAGSLQYDTAEELCSMATVNCMRHRDVVAVTGRNVGRDTKRRKPKAMRLRMDTSVLSMSG